VVDDRLQRSGLGTRLIRELIEHAHARGLAALNGLVLYDNWPMLSLAAKLGFELWEDADPALTRVEKTLDSRRTKWTQMQYATASA